MTGGRIGVLMATAAALTGYLVWSGDAALILPLLDRERPSGLTLQQTAEPLGLQAEKSGAPVSNPLSGLSASAFDEMIERPLFNPTRAPAPVATAEAMAPVEEAPPPEPENGTGPQDFTLLGLGAREGTWTAVIRLNKTNEVFHLKQGEAMAEWTFSGAAAREVTLSNADKSIQLKLFQDLGTRPAGLIPSPMMQEGEPLQDQQ